MASNHQISSLYTRYKMGQSYLSQWLLVATKQHAGYAAEIRLSPTELDRLADLLVEKAQSTGKLPDGLDDSVRVLESVVRGRKECSVWYRHVESDGHDGHLRAISVLHLVVAKLKSLQTPTRNLGQEVSSRCSDANPIENFFQALSFEHIEDSSHVESPQTRRESSVKKVKAAHHTKKSEREQEERSLAAVYILEDFATTREPLQKVWASYKEGTTALPHATLLTEVASLIWENAINAATQDFPGLDLYSNIADHLGLKQVATNELGSGQDTDTTEDALCVPAWTLLSLLCTQLECLEAPSPANSAHLLEVTKQIRECHFLGEVILALQPYFLALIKGQVRFGCMDLFTKSMVQFCSDRKITTRLVFDVQIQMDIFTTLGREGSDCSDVLMCVTKHTVGLLRPYDANQRPCIPKHRQQLEKLVTEATGMTLDQIEKHEGGKVDSMAASLPLLAGAYIDAIQQELHLDGAMHCNEGSIVVATAHLYKALKATGPLKASWSDMEEFIAVQDAKALGFQEVAKDTLPTMARAARHYGIAMGVPPSRYAPTKSRAGHANLKRVALPPLSGDKEPSKYQGMIHVSSIFIVKMLADFGEFDSLDCKMAPRIPAVLHAVIRDLMPRHPDLFDISFKESCESSEGLTPVQALHGLQKSLELNEAAVNFDLHGLLASSCEALGGVVEKLGSKLPGGLQPHEMVDEILWRGAQREATIGWASNDQLVRGASQAMGSYLNENGDSCQARNKAMAAACRASIKSGKSKKKRKGGQKK